MATPSAGLRTKPRAARTRRRKIVFGLVSLVLFVVVAEGLLNFWAWLRYPRLTVTDREIGWIYKPTDRPLTRRLSAAIQYTVSINPDGFRDEPFRADPEWTRVMVLGDSMTFGMEVDQEQVYPRVMEQLLREKLGDPKIDVMNFGMTGFSTGQELLLLRRFADTYSPRVVLLTLFELNDYDDNLSAFSAGRYVPGFRLVEGRLVPVNAPTPVQRVLTALRDRSVLFYAASSRVGPLREWFDVHDPASEPEKVELMQRLLDEIHDYCSARAIPLVLAYVRDPDQPPSRHEAIVRWCDRHRVRMADIDLRPDERVGGTGHWNERGHARAATLFGRELLEAGYLAAPSR